MFLRQWQCLSADSFRCHGYGFFLLLSFRFVNSYTASHTHSIFPFILVGSSRIVIGSKEEQVDEKSYQWFGATVQSSGKTGMILVNTDIQYHLLTWRLFSLFPDAVSFLPSHSFPSDSHDKHTHTHIDTHDLLFRDNRDLHSGSGMCAAIRSLQQQSEETRAGGHMLLVSGIIYRIFGVLTLSYQTRMGLSQAGILSGRLLGCDLKGRQACLHRSSWQLVLAGASLLPEPDRQPSAN